MNDTQEPPASQHLPPGEHSRRRNATDLGVIGATAVAASVALPIMYAHRLNGIIWGLGILAFVGFPLLAGIVRRKPSLAASLMAATLLLGCPVVYEFVNPLPVRFELFRDAFFLTTASSLTFVSAEWAASSARLRQWLWLLAAVSLIVVAAGSIAVMISIFMYLE
jgi:hypothetical protein